MLIKEFCLKFMSEQGNCRLFDVLRRVSRMEKGAFLSEDKGWPEWPPLVPGDPGIPLAKPEVYRVRAWTGLRVARPPAAASRAAPGA